MGTIIADEKVHQNATVAIVSGNLVVTGKKDNGRPDRTVYYVTGKLRKMHYALLVRDMINAVMTESEEPLDIEKFLDIIGSSEEYKALQP